MTPCQKEAGLVTLAVMPIDASKAALVRWMSGRVATMLSRFRSRRVNKGGGLARVMDELVFLSSKLMLR